MSGNVYLYILTAFAVTYLIRVLPLTLIKKEITNRFVRSFLYYVPYVTLTVMTFPAIVTATGNVYAGLASLVVGIAVAVFTENLFLVAGASCVVVFIVNLLANVL